MRIIHAQAALLCNKKVSRKMKQFPHNYATISNCKPTGVVITQSRECSKLFVAEPEEFDGKTKEWSPEQMFVSTVANCLLLTFRAIANASKFEYVDMSCVANGKLDRIDGINLFTQIDIKVDLFLHEGSDKDKGLRLLNKAEKQCLIKNSITAEINFNNEILQTNTIIT